MIKGTFFISWDEHDSSYVTLHPVLQRNQHHRNPQMMSFISAYACPYATWYCKKSLRGLTPLRVLLTQDIVMTTTLLNMNRRVLRLAHVNFLNRVRRRLGMSLKQGPSDVDSGWEHSHEGHNASISCETGFQSTSMSYSCALSRG